MTPEIISRGFSNDQFVFDRVFFENLYKLKGHKNSDKVILDIGAHAGYFSLLALSLGAKKVYSFEPFVDSYKLLLNNCYTHPFAGRFVPYQTGVYTERRIGQFSAPLLVNGIYFDFAGVGLKLSQEENHYPCQCVELDDILRDFCFGQTIDVLKINIGYAEKEILAASALLALNVNSVCGEFSLNEEELLSIKKDMVIKGFVHSFSAPQEGDRTLAWFSKTPLGDNYVV